MVFPHQKAFICDRHHVFFSPHEILSHEIYLSFFVIGYYLLIDLFIIYTLPKFRKDSVAV